MMKYEVRRRTEMREEWETKRLIERIILGAESSTASAGEGRGVLGGMHSGSGPVLWICRKRASGGMGRI